MPKWCDEGEFDALNIYLKNASQNSNLYLGLFLNSTEPAENATLSNISEPSGNGYSRITLPPADWSISGTSPTTASQPQKTFTASGGAWGNVYGYFITTAASGTNGRLITVEIFSNGPYNVQNGQSVRVVPRITCD